MNKPLILRAKIIKIENKITQNGLPNPYQVLYLDNNWRIMNFCKYNEIMQIGSEYYFAVKNSKLISWSWSREELII